MTLRDLPREWRSRAAALRDYAPPAATAWEKAAEELELMVDADPEAPEPPPVTPSEPTWRERLWTAPAATRIGRDELCEALDKSKSWLYEHTKKRKIPYRKDESGELVFVVGEIRAWLRSREVVIVPGELAHREVARLTNRKE